MALLLDRCRAAFAKQTRASAAVIPRRGPTARSHAAHAPLGTSAPIRAPFQEMAFAKTAGQEPNIVFAVGAPTATIAPPASAPLPLPLPPPLPPPPPAAASRAAVEFQTAPPHHRHRRRHHHHRRRRHHHHHRFRRHHRHPRHPRFRHHHRHPRHPRFRRPRRRFRRNSRREA